MRSTKNYVPRLPKSVYNELSDEGKAKLAAAKRRQSKEAKKRADLKKMAKMVANTLKSTRSRSKKRY